MAYTHEEIVMIVTGANVAGYLEQAERIFVDDDEQLTAFITASIDRYEEATRGMAWWDAPSWRDFIESELYVEFGDAEEEKSCADE